MPESQPFIEVSTLDFYKHVKTATMADETTFAHRLRARNSFLKEGDPYGAALAKVIIDRGVLRRDACLMVEVGGGLGDLAKSALPVLLKYSPNLSYVFVDISPTLLAAQRDNMREFGERVSFLECDALHLAGKISDVDLVIANEVIGDLPANVYVGDDWRGAAAQRGYNYGAFRFVEVLKTILAPDGSAFITEYSSDRVVSVELLNHTEVAIEPGSFEKIIVDNGFHLRSGTLAELLSINRDDFRIDDKLVNVWLLAKEKWSKTHPFSERGSKLLKEAEQIFIEDPAKYTRLDKAVSIEEFGELAKQNHWETFDPDDLPLVSLYWEACHFMYFELRKTSHCA